MLKRRIIPKLQLSLKQSFRGDKPVLVVTRQFDQKRAIGDPLSQAKIYEAQLADELILVDLIRSEDSWLKLLSTLEKISSALATPISVGGGLNKFKQVQILLDHGADKVILNSAAINNPTLINQIASTYGSQCLVVSIDVKKSHESSEWIVWSQGGRLKTDKKVLNWSKEVEERGAGEIMITSIDKDGECNGMDLDLIAQVSQFSSIPVIASGGCGLAEHFIEGFKLGASGVAAGTFFCQRDQNPIQCRSQIYNSGIPIRINL